MYKNRILSLFCILLVGFWGSSANGAFVLDHFGGLETVIGPDPYGILAKYRDDYIAGLPGMETDEISGADFWKFQAKMAEHKKQVFSKYKQVTGIFMSTSRFFYNYRHAGNTFSVLSQYMKYGMMSNKYMTPIMPETCVCHPTNTAAGRIYIDSKVDMDKYAGKLCDDLSNKYNEDMIIKYNGHGLRKKHFRYVMTGRYPKHFPNSLKAFTQYTVDDDPPYTKIVYMTGHGGDSYLQFQAKDFISSLEMAKHFQEMHIKEPKMKILTLLDTCEASTMYKYVDKEIPLAWVASSVKGQSRYSHNPNHYISISTCDKFTYVLQSFLENVLSGIVRGIGKASVSRLSLKQLLRNYERNVEKERIDFGVNKSMLGEDDPGKKLDKVYLGQFIFNYRRVYFNDLKFNVRKIKNPTPGKFRTFRVYDVANLKKRSAKVEKRRRGVDWFKKEDEVTTQMVTNGVLPRPEPQQLFPGWVLATAVCLALWQEIKLKRPISA